MAGGAQGGAGAAGAAAAGGAPARLPGGVVMALAFGQVLAWSSLFYVFAALLPRWEAEFDGPPPALGLSLALGVSALAAPAAGRAIDRGLAPVMMPLGALGGAGLLLLLSVAEGWAAFLAIWAAMGLAFAAALYEPCFALLGRVLGTAARPAIAQVTLVAGFATALSFPTAGALADAYGWRGALPGLAAVAALLAAPLLAWGARAAERRAPAGAVRGRGGPKGPGWRVELARPGALRIALAFACVAGSHGIVSAHMLALLPARGVEGGAALIVAAMVGPCQVAGRLMLLSAPGRWRAAVMLVPAFAALAAGLAVLLLGHGIVAAGAFALLLGAAYGALTILRPAVLAETAGTERFGTLSGLVAAPFAASFAVAPFLGGVLREAGGASAALAVAAALPVVGLVLAAPLARGRG